MKQGGYMTRKTIIAGACTLLLSAAFKAMSDLALAERSYHAFGGELCLLIFVFAAWVIIKTIKDIVGKEKKWQEHTTRTRS